ncbi:hypothetical protein ACX9R5_13310 [Rathayibacter sp. CAU 1779]
MSAIILGVLALGLTACTAAAPPVDATTHLSTGGRHTCAPGTSIELDGQSRTFLLSGECASVSVNGKGITVRIERAVSLNIQGESDSITVADRVGSAIIKGNGISLTADSVGSVQITGQNNSISVPALGSVTVQGDHNVVTTHTKPSDYRVTGQDDTLHIR